MRFPQPKIGPSKFSNRIRHHQKLGILKRLYSELSKIEKILLLSFVGLFAISSVILTTTFIREKAKGMAFTSQSYVEGIIAQSKADIDPSIDRLTKIGLVDFDKKGAIIPRAAQSWTISSDNKTYTFTLRPEIDKETLDKSVISYSILFPEAQIKTEDRKLIFELKQPFSPFLTSLSVPIFEFGPYVISKEDKNIIKLVARNKPLDEQAKIEEIILRIYPDNFSLVEALKKGEIQAVSSTQNIATELLESMNTFTVQLPRKIYLFFNNKSELLTHDIRISLANNQKLSKKIKLELVTLGNEPHTSLAEKIKNLWEPLGAEVAINIVSAQNLATNIIPERAYDVLIYGLDLGYGIDLYPFWHSSQISEKGLNLANFANVEADKILEEARLTTDSKKTQELHDKFNQILEKEVPAIELEDVNWEFATPKNIIGIKSHPGYTSADRFRFVSEWHK